MKLLGGTDLFSVIHDYFIIYLPRQKRCSPHTIRSYAKVWETLLDFTKERNGIKLSEITFEMLDSPTIAEFLDMLEIERGCSVSTRNHRLHCIRAFYEYAANMHPTIMAFKAEVLKVPRKKQDKVLLVKYMDEESVKILLEQPDASSQKGLRDKIMLILLYDSAARVHELLNIKLCDIKFGSFPTVVLNGKGSKIRTVPIMKKTAEHLQKYISVFHNDKASTVDDFLFYVIRDEIKRRMSENNVRSILNSYGKKAQQQFSQIPNNVHPHLLRHSRAMHLYQHGMDLILVSQWLGHAELEATLIYAHADTEKKRKAIEAAQKGNVALSDKDSTSRFKIDDDLMLKRLCGLR